MSARPLPIMIGANVSNAEKTGSSSSLKCDEACRSEDIAFGIHLDLAGQIKTRSGGVARRALWQRWCIAISTASLVIPVGLLENPQSVARTGNAAHQSCGGALAKPVVCEGRQRWTHQLCLNGSKQ